MSKKEKFYYLYKTTNLINGKYYYGMHCTSNLEDGYLGSGKILNLSIKKYGKENFKKEILSFHKDRQELAQAEKDLITLEVINESQCLNLIPGGTGGSFVSEQHKQAFIKAGPLGIKLKYKTDPDYKIELQKRGSKNFKKAWQVGSFDNIARFTGKKHSVETKEKMKATRKGMQVGQKNSQAGTCWIHNNTENKKIKKQELENYLLQGWSKGRKMKM